MNYQIFFVLRQLLKTTTGESISIVSFEFHNKDSRRNNNSESQ